MGTLTPSLFACDIKVKMRCFDKCLIYFENDVTYRKNDTNCYAQISLLSVSEEKIGHNQHLTDLLYEKEK